MNFTKPNNDPQNYYWWSEGFSQDELRKIYSDLESIPFQQATTIGASEDDTIKEIRSSSIKWIPKTQEWNWLYEKLMNMAVESNSIWNFDLISADELIQYTEYYDVEGGHYDWHQDIGPGDASKRKVSITVQLSDPSEYEGGGLELEFDDTPTDPKIISVLSSQGDIVVFPSVIKHRAVKVTKGIRYSATGWVSGPNFK